MLSSPRYLWTALAVLTSTVSAQYVPDRDAEITRELQHILLDAGSAALINAVSPCTKYEDPNTGATNNNAGRQSAAEWVRTAFRKLDFLEVWFFPRHVQNAPRKNTPFCRITRMLQFCKAILS